MQTDVWLATKAEGAAKRAAKKAAATGNAASSAVLVEVNADTEVPDESDGEGEQCPPLPLWTPRSMEPAPPPPDFGDVCGELAGEGWMSTELGFLVPNGEESTTWTDAAPVEAAPDAEAPAVGEEAPAVGDKRPREDAL